MNDETLGYLIAGAIVVGVFGFYAIAGRVINGIGRGFGRMVDKALPVRDDEEEGR